MRRLISIKARMFSSIRSPRGWRTPAREYRKMTTDERDRAISKIERSLAKARPAWHPAAAELTPSAPKTSRTPAGTHCVLLGWGAFHNPSSWLFFCRYGGFFLLYPAAPAYVRGGYGDPAALLHPSAGQVSGHTACAPPLRARAPARGLCFRRHFQGRVLVPEP